MQRHFFTSDTLQIDINASVTVKEVGGVSSNNGGSFGESEGIDNIFVDFYCVRIEIEQL